MEIFTQPERLRDYLEGFGVWAPLMFALLQLLQVLLAPIPGNVLAFAGGLLFGFWKAFFLSWASIAVGSLLCFGIGRKLGRAALRKLLKPSRFDRYEAFIKSDRNKARTGMVIFLSFLLPFVPDDLLCLLAGVSDIRFRTFTLLVLIARPWGLVAAASFGAYGGQMPLWLTITLLIVCITGAIAAFRYAEQLEAFMMRLIHAIRERLGRHRNERHDSDV